MLQKVFPFYDLFYGNNSSVSVFCKVQQAFPYALAWAETGNLRQ